MFPDNHGTHWSDEEDQQLHRKFSYYINRCGREIDASIKSLANIHKRTERAIALRLYHLGLIHEDYIPISKENMVMNNINGRFWMVQNGDLNGQVDSHGNAVLHWPGRSVFNTKALAVEAAKDLARQHQDKKFYVMEAVSMHEATKPQVNTTVFKRTLK